MHQGPVFVGSTIGRLDDLACDCASHAGNRPAMGFFFSIDSTIEVDKAMGVVNFQLAGCHQPNTNARMLLDNRIPHNMTCGQLFWIIMSSALVSHFNVNFAAELSISPSSRLSSSQGSTPTEFDLMPHNSSVLLMQWNSKVDLARVVELRAHEKPNVSTVLVSMGFLQTHSSTRNV